MSPLSSLSPFLSVISVWVVSHGGDDSLYDLLPQSLWISTGKIHRRQRRLEWSFTMNFIICISLWSFEKRTEKPELSVFFKDKLGAYFLSKMDSTNKKTQEVCNSHSFIICIDQYRCTFYLCTLTLQISYCVWFLPYFLNCFFSAGFQIFFISLSLCHCSSVRWLVSVMVACPVWGACWTEGWVLAELRAGPIRFTAYWLQPIACWLRSTRVPKQVHSFSVMLEFLCKTRVKFISVLNFFKLLNLFVVIC